MLKTYKIKYNYFIYYFGLDFRLHVISIIVVIFFFYPVVQHISLFYSGVRCFLRGQFRESK